MRGSCFVDHAFVTKHLASDLYFVRYFLGCFDHAQGLVLLDYGHSGLLQTGLIFWIDVVEDFLC